MLHLWSVWPPNGPMHCYNSKQGTRKLFIGGPSVATTVPENPPVKGVNEMGNSDGNDKCVNYGPQMLVKREFGNNAGKVEGKGSNQALAKNKAGKGVEGVNAPNNVRIWRIRKVYRGSDREFCGFVNDADLHDLGFVGPPFTWKRTGVESRLDRVLGSTTWQETFPDAVVKHLNWYKSDHRPLLLQLEGCAMMTRVDRPFRFLAAWVLDERFSSFVSGNWSTDLAWAENIDQFTMARDDGFSFLDGVSEEQTRRSPRVVPSPSQILTLLS
ncbi:hypothetical protein K1719_035812 [Acacia pycnantha]|nr:hypothetical protein K1719_035812 [Acacia pycnantha]